MCGRNRTRHLTKRTRVELQLVMKIVEFEVMTKRAWFTMINAHQQAETEDIYGVSDSAGTDFFLSKI